MSGSQAIEVELALARDQDCVARAVFYAPSLVSLGNSADAVLPFDDSALSASHDVLEISEEGAFLVVAEGMDLQLVRGDERATLDSLRADGLALKQDGGWRVELPVGANAVLSAGEANLMLKCRPAPASEDQVLAAGEPPALACGKCGSDLQFVVDCPGALSPCPRCNARNRTQPPGAAQAEQQAAAPDPEPEAEQQPVPVAAERLPSLGPEGTESDLPIASSLTAGEGAADDGPTDLGLGEDEQDAPGVFEEEATQPGVSPGRTRAAARLQLEEEAEEEEAPPRRRRRRKKRRSASPWTPRLVSLIVVGLVSGALGLGMIFYAVVIRGVGS
jgi:hypothetical protein